MAEHDRNGSGHRSGAEHDRILEELRGLLDVLALRVEEFLLTRCGHEGAVPSPEDGESAPAGSTDRCATCPLCAVLALLRGERREPGTSLFEQLTALLAELRRQLADGRSSGSGGPPGGDVASEGRDDTPSSTSGRVQHIGVRRVRGKVMDDETATPDRTSTG